MVYKLLLAAFATLAAANDAYSVDYMVNNPAGAASSGSP